MKHVPFLLCGLMLAAVPLPRAEARNAATKEPHAAASGARSGQRLARLDAPAPRTTPDIGTEGGCLSMIADDPDGAVDYADTWSHHGGRDAAARCRALATIAQGDPEPGAAALDVLSRDPALTATRRALMAGDAAHAWLLASRPDRALAASGLAVALDPSPGSIIEHARAALAAHQPALAIGDLSPVLAAHADLMEALVVRASALRETGAFDRARADIEAACRQDPDAPEALLERGILREHAGDLDGARIDWTRVIAVSPDMHEADLAQQDLALLDAGPEAR